MVRDRKERKFKSRGDTGLVEDVRQVALDCLFAESELFGDIPVAASFHDATDHLELARSQPVGFLLRRRRLLHQVVQGRNKIYDAFAADPVVAGANGADGGLQMAGQRIFQHNTTSANMERFDDLLGCDGGGQEQDLYGRRALHDGAHGFKTRQPRHRHVEKQNVRLQFESLRDRFVAVISFADYVETFFSGEHIAHTDPDYGMVVRQYDSCQRFHSSGALQGSCRPQTTSGTNLHDLDLFSDS